MKIKAFSFLAFISITMLFFLNNSNKEPDCIVITGGHFFDSTTHTMRPNKQIILENNSINFENEKSKSCRQISLKKHFILPGLIDAHTHLLAGDRQKVDTWKRALELSASRPHMSRIYIGEKNSKDMLFSGFTSVRDLGNSGNFLDVILSDRIKKNIALGPDLIISGPGLATHNTQINLKYNKNEYTLISPSTDLAVLLKKYKEQNIPWIKIYADNSNPNEAVDADLIRRAVDAAHQLGLKIAVHGIYRWSVENALASLPDSIEHFNSVPVVQKFESATKPYIVLTDFSLKTCQSSMIENDCAKTISDFKKRITWLKENNFNLIFGSDAVLDFTHKFKNRGEAALSSLLSLSEMGLSNLEIIIAATSMPGKMLELNAGEIAVGQQADLVIYKENPLDNIQTLLRPNIVISNGKIICQSEAECAL